MSIYKTLPISLEPLGIFMHLQLGKGNKSALNIITGYNLEGFSEYSLKGM